MSTLPKLLIAEHDSELRSALESACSQFCLVRSCADGMQAKSLLQSFCPDILLLDLVLPYVDGLALLRELPEENQPLIIVSSFLFTPYILSALQAFPISYCFLKPADLSAVAACVQDLASAVQPAPAVPAAPKDSLYTFLLELGLAPRADGFSYLLEAIPRYQQDPNQALTKELYPDVARIFQKSPASIERSIRSAIECAWQRGGYRNWGAYFSTAADGTIIRPSNGDFLHAIANAFYQQEHIFHRVG